MVSAKRQLFHSSLNVLTKFHGHPGPFKYRPHNRIIHFSKSMILNGHAVTGDLTIISFEVFVISAKGFHGVIKDEAQMVCVHGWTEMNYYGCLHYLMILIDVKSVNFMEK